MTIEARVDAEARTEPCPETASLYARNRLEFGNEQCMQERRRCITATDVAVILGINKYMSKLELARKKYNMTEPFEGNEATRHGNSHEARALRVYERVTGNKLMERPCGFVLGSRLVEAIDWIGATPDGVLMHKPVLVEVKCPYWNPDLENQQGLIPAIYYPQLQCQMAVTGFREVHFVRYRPSYFKEYVNEYIDVTVVGFNEDYWRDVALPAIKEFKESLEMAPPPPKLRREKRVKRGHTIDYSLTPENELV